MATDYPGNPSYPITITVPDDGDPNPAESVAVALEQLADRTAFLAAFSGGSGMSFTNATFHGTTTFADGTIVAPALSGVSIVATSGGINLQGAPFRVNSGAFELNGLTITIGNNPFLQVEIGAGGFNFHDALVNFSAPFTPALKGRIKKRTAILNTARTFGIGEADIFTVPLLTGDIVCPLSDADAEVGDTLRVNAWQNTAAFTLQITYGSHTWQLRNTTTGGTSYIVWAEFLFTGSVWILNDGVVADTAFNT